MRFLTVRELKSAPGRIWSSTDDEDIVVTSNGRPVALLTPIDEATIDQELELRRRTRALLALERAHREAVRQGSNKLTDQEIEAEIDAVRSNLNQSRR